MLPEGADPLGIFPSVILDAETLAPGLLLAPPRPPSGDGIRKEALDGSVPAVV